MARLETNFYRIDDVLLRAGSIGLVTVLGIGVCWVLVTMAEGAPNAERAVLRLVHDQGLAFGVAAAFPFAALRIGFVVRGREKKIAAIWKLLQRNAQLSVGDLLANSDFDARDVDRAIRVLNNRGLGHYVWNRRDGMIQDGRLRTLQLHVEKCDACGASVSLEVPIGFSEVPACPFCDDPVAVESLEARRHEALEAMRAEHRPRRVEDLSSVPFSIPLFLLLVFVFWPAALLYAWIRCR